jgi:MFS family permease
MRLRYLLPAIEIAVSVACVIVPLLVYLQRDPPKAPDGTEIICHDNCPQPNLYGVSSAMLARGMNLPAVIVVMPALLAKWQYSNDRHDYFHDAVWQGAGYVVVGPVVWFFLGLFLEDVIAWRRDRIRPAFRFSSLILALAAAFVATMQMAYLDDRFFRGPEFAWVVFWDIVWILIGYSGLSLCILQLVQAKRENARAKVTSRLS